MLLQITGINKSYGVKAVLSGITLQVQERERIGIVGVNGAGKSTLLQIMAGELSYDSGDLFKAKETKIGYLAQNSGLQSEQTIWREMIGVFADLTEMERQLRILEQQMSDPSLISDSRNYESVLQRYSSLSDQFRERGGYETETKIKSVLHGMGFASFSPDTEINTLSGGQKTRLALAKLLLQEPDLLLLDEPTNHLDIPTLTWLESYLRAYSGAVLVVSHDRYFLDAIVDSIFEIERTSSKKYTGNYTKYIELKAAEFENHLKQFERQQEEIAKMEDFIRRNIVRASTTKRAQSRRKALEKIERIDKPLGDLKRARFSFEIERPSGKDVLHANDLSVSFGDSDALFRHANLQLRRGETVALIGPNGIGKSTLLKALIHQTELGEALEQPIRVSGNIQWGVHVSIGFYDQEQTHLNPTNTVLEEVWNSFPHVEEARIRTVLGNFLFSGEDVLKKISSLSGGEKARVALAKLMLLKANVLVLDEPTNHLDLFSKEVLETALLDYEGTLLFISHDRYFLNKIAESIVELTPDGTNYFLGNYDDYLHKKREVVELEEERNPIESSSISSKTTNPYETEKQNKREERAKQRKIAQLELAIEQLENEISELEQLMAQPDVYQNYERLQPLQTDIEQKKSQLQQYYNDWETLAE